MAGQAAPKTLEEALEHIMQQPAPPQRLSGLDEDAAPPSRRNSKGATMGVTKHKRTQRYEAHIWLDKKQIYLGAYDGEVQAARAHDIMALRCKDMDCATNYPQEDYAQIVAFLPKSPQADIVASLRSYSKLLSGSRQRSIASSRGLGQSSGVKRKQQQQFHDMESDRNPEHLGISTPCQPTFDARAAASGEGTQNWHWSSEAGAAAAYAAEREAEQAAAAAREAGRDTLPLRQSQRLRAASAAAAAAREPSGNSMSMEEGGGGLGNNSGPFVPLTIQPLSLNGAPPLAPPPIRTVVRSRPLHQQPHDASEGAGQPAGGAGASLGWGQLPAAKPASWALSQRALSAAGSLGSGTPLSPASSLGVKTLLSLAQQPPSRVKSPPESPAGQGLMPPPAPAQPPASRCAGPPSEARASPAHQQAQEPAKEQLHAMQGAGGVLWQHMAVPITTTTTAAVVPPSASELLQRLHSAGLVLPITPGSGSLSIVPTSASAAAESGVCLPLPQMTGLPSSQGITSSMPPTPFLPFVTPSAAQLLLEVRQVTHAAEAGGTAHSPEVGQQQSSTLRQPEVASMAQPTTVCMAQQEQQQHPLSDAMFPAPPPELLRFLRDAVPPEVASRAAQELLSLETALLPAASAPQ